MALGGSKERWSHGRGLCEPKWQVSNRAGYRTIRQHHRVNLRADDSSHRQTKSLSIERQRSFYIVHPDSDAWFHSISTVPPSRMKDRKLEISTYTQHDVSSLAGCWKSLPASHVDDAQPLIAGVSPFPPVSRVSCGYPAQPGVTLAIRRRRTRCFRGRCRRGIRFPPTGTFLAGRNSGHPVAI